MSNNCETCRALAEDLVPVAATVDESWIQKRLEAHDDGAIDMAMTRSDAITSAAIRSSLQRIIEDQTVETQRSAVKARLFAVPIVLRSDDPIAASECVLTEMPAFLKSFQDCRLHGKNDGVVILANLISHEQLAATSYSQLYALGRGMMDSCVIGGDEQLSELAEGEFPDCMPLPNGFISIRYMIGISFWDADNPEPALWQDGNTALAEKWKNHVRGLIDFQFLDSTGPTINIRVGTPRPIYAAILDGLSEVIRSVLGEFVSDISAGSQPQAVLAMTSDGSAPAGCGISVEINTATKDAYWTFSHNVRVSDADRIATTYKELEATLVAAGAVISGKSFASTQHGHAASRYCH